MEDRIKLLLKLVIFCIANRKLKVFLPGTVLPYGNLEKGQSLSKAAKKIFLEWLTFDLSYGYLEQLYTFSYPTEPSVAVTYYILLPPLLAGKIKSSDWKEKKDLKKSILDREIIIYAIQRLRWKVEYTNVVYSLLPEKFTLSELQQTYEAILRTKLDKRNFRKKILSLGLLSASGKKKLIGPARPAEIYEFKTKKPFTVKVFS